MGKKTNAAKVAAERAAQVANQKGVVLGVQAESEVVETPPRPPKLPFHRPVPERRSLSNSPR